MKIMPVSNGNRDQPKSFYRTLRDKMKRFPAILFCLFFCAEVQAASFDCDQAVSAPEKIICANDELSQLDTRLGLVYDVTTSKASPDKAKRLRTEQRQWLRSVRNQCADAACLLAAYKARLDKLDPLVDNLLTCEEMRQFPEVAFSRETGPDLGSGNLPVDGVDFECPESLSKQKFMQRLIGLGEQIRGQDGLPQICTGSMVHAQWRYYHFDLTEASFSPEMLLQNQTPFSTPIDWNSPKYAGATVRYFKQWSEQSLFNRALYGQFTAEFDSVLPILTKHYQDKFRLPKQDAQSAARTALMRVVGRAAGSSPRAEFKEDSALVQAIRESQSKYEDIKRELDNTLSPDEIYDALIVALINNRSLHIVSVLAEALSPGALQHLDETREPLLSFAIGNQQNLEYLLSKQAPVDAANDFGKTALFYAVGASNHKAVEALLKAGADVNHAYKSEKELKPSGSECDYPNLWHTRRTPLMHAAQHSDVRMIDTLLQAGARLDAADDVLYNALDYAVMGGNRDNETYLKSLGLEFGSPKYSSAPDPAVREQTIQDSISIDGSIGKMLIAPGRPDILAVLAGPGTSHDWHLYLISIADPDHPKVLSSFPAAYAGGDFALNPDGKHAYVWARTDVDRSTSSTGKKSGLNIIDITDPEKPTLFERIEGDFLEKVPLSPDGKFLYLQEGSQKPSSRLLVYNVESEPARIECSNPFDPAVSYEPFVFFPDEPLLLFCSTSGQRILFDIKNPCSPVKLAEINWPENMSKDMVGLSGRAVIAGWSGIEKFRITGAFELQRLARYETGLISRYNVNAKTGDVAALITSDSASSSHDKDVALFRPTKAGRFRLTDRFRLPGKELESVLQTDTGHVFIGWKGGLGVGRIPKE